MRQFEIIGDNQSIVIVGKSPEVLGWAIMLNFNTSHLTPLGPTVELRRGPVQLLEFVSVSSAIPVEMAGSLICAWMAHIGDRAVFGITDSFANVLADERSCDQPGNVLPLIETYTSNDLQLFKLDADHWKAWAIEHQIDFGDAVEKL
jgi:hypothetical protein